MQFEETAILGAFDSNRTLIYAIATKVYSRGTKGSCDIVPTVRHNSCPGTESLQVVAPERALLLGTPGYAARTHAGLYQ
jgi:hypothetical protein